MRWGEETARLIGLPDQGGRRKEEDGDAIHSQSQNKTRQSRQMKKKKLTQAKKQKKQEKKKTQTDKKNRPKKQSTPPPRSKPRPSCAFEQMILDTEYYSANQTFPGEPLP
jgi:sRNA-binding protein